SLTFRAAMTCLQDRRIADAHMVARWRTGETGAKNDAHAAEPDLAGDAVVAQLTQGASETRVRRALGWGSGRAFRDGDVLQHGHGGKNLLDFRRQFRMPVDVLAQRRPLALAVAVEELFREFEDDLGLRICVRHARTLRG